MPEWFEASTGLLFVVMFMISTLTDIANIMPTFWLVFVIVVIWELEDTTFQCDEALSDCGDDLAPTPAPTTADDDSGPVEIVEFVGKLITLVFVALVLVPGLLFSLCDPRIPVCTDKRLGVMALLVTVLLILVYPLVVLLGALFSCCCGCCGCCYSGGKIFERVLWPFEHNPLVARAKALEGKGINPLLRICCCTCYVRNFHPPEDEDEDRDDWFWYGCSCCPKETPAETKVPAEKAAASSSAPTVQIQVSAPHSDIENTKADADEAVEAVEDDTVVDDPKADANEAIEAVGDETVVDDPKVDADEAVGTVDDETVIDDPKADADEAVEAVEDGTVVGDPKADAKEAIEAVGDETVAGDPKVDADEAVGAVDGEIVIGDPKADADEAADVRVWLFVVIQLLCSLFRMFSLGPSALFSPLSLFSRRTRSAVRCDIGFPSRPSASSCSVPASCVSRRTPECRAGKV